MRLINDDDDAAVALGLLGFEQLLGLGHDLGLEEARSGAEGADDGDVEATGAEGGVGDVDDLVAEWVERGPGSAGGDRLAGADLAGDDAQGRLLDAVQDAGDSFLVGLPREELGRSQRLCEGRTGEAKVGQPGCLRNLVRGGRGNGHQSSSVMSSCRKAMAPVSSASCSASTWPR